MLAHIFCLYPKNAQFLHSTCIRCWSQWWHGLRRRSAAARLLRLWVRIPRGAWIFVVSFVCCQVEVSATSWSLVQRRSYRLWCVVVCDLETSWMRRPWPTGGLSRNSHTSTYIIYVSPTCFGTYIPSSGRIIRHFLKQQNAMRSCWFLYSLSASLWTHVDLML
jgi:hypothetical protein